MSLAMLACALCTLSCSRGWEGEPVAAAAVREQKPAAPATASEQRVVRSTGTVQARKALSIRVPQISAQNSRVTLTHLVPNGSKVKQGDLLAEFDQITLADEEREGLAKLADLNHQIEERKAKIGSDSAKRVALIREAEADLAKAEIGLRKGPILSDIDREKNKVKAESSKARVGSLKKSHGLHEIEEAASVRVIELKRDRQQVALDRTRNNMNKLSIKAAQDGMVAIENTWRSGSMGPPQEGDQMFPGQPVLRIFDPSWMVVEATINEPDVAALSATTKARIHLDAYPNVVFAGVLESASPVATAGLDTPVRTFSARFRIEQQDPRLLPDLSASLEIVLDDPKRVETASAKEPQSKP